MIKRRVTILLLCFFASIDLAIAQKGLSETQRLERIAVLGLSASETGNDNNPVSYLFPLWERLFAGGYRFEFIGLFAGKCRIGALNYSVLRCKEDGPKDADIDTICGRYPADVLLLQCGNNGFDACKSADTIIAAYRSVIYKVLTINPGTKILVAGTIVKENRPADFSIAELNFGLEKMVRGIKRANVVWVDVAKFIRKKQEAGFAQQAEENRTNWLADAWYNALKKVLPKSGPSFRPEIVRYKNTEKRTLELHVFKPKQMMKGKRRPAIVYFFGGGWSSGTPLQFYRECAWYASKGMVAVAADYRIASLDGTTPFESVEDAKDAIRWIRANAARWNVDPERIAAAGASAGGHLAAATGTLNEPGSSRGKPDYKPNLLLLYYPVIDNSASGYGPETVKARYREISPLHNIDRDTPPTLFILGTQDRLIPVKTAEDFRSRMKEQGVDCDLYLFEGAGHPIFYYSKVLPREYYLIRTLTDNFLKKYGFL